MQKIELHEVSTRKMSTQIFTAIGCFSFSKVRYSQNHNLLRTTGFITALAAVTCYHQSLLASGVCVWQFSEPDKVSCNMW